MHVLDAVVLERVVLRKDHLDFVALLHHRAPERGDNVPEPAHLGDGRHLNGDVHDVHRRRRGGLAHRVNPARHWEVVVELLVVVVLRDVGGGVAKDEVHRVCVRGAHDGRLKVRLTAASGHHADRPDHVLVLPAVPGASHENLLGAAKVCAARAVVDGHQLPRPRLLRVAVKHLLPELAHQRQRRLFRLRLSLLHPRQPLRVCTVLHHPFLANLEVPLAGAEVHRLRNPRLCTRYRKVVVAAPVVVPRLATVAHDHIDSQRRGRDAHINGEGVLLFAGGGRHQNLERPWRVVADGPAVEPDVEMHLGAAGEAGGGGVIRQSHLAPGDDGAHDDVLVWRPEWLVKAGKRVVHVPNLLLRAAPLLLLLLPLHRNFDRHLVGRLSHVLFVVILLRLKWNLNLGLLGLELRLNLDRRLRLLGPLDLDRFPFL
mmetsp:Transcript_11286/g.37137  ORF Transcript_11286/g.37137 Transcript_11286/m.37137 type:complete len:428 (-) Transcript_11286:344-1627(-)